MYFPPKTLKPGYGSDFAKIVPLRYFLLKAIRLRDVA